MKPDNTKRMLLCSMVLLVSIAAEAQVVFIGENHNYINNHTAHQLVIDRYEGKKIFLYEYNFLLSAPCLNQTTDSVSFFKDCWLSVLSGDVAKQYNNNVYNSSYQTIKKNRGFHLYYDLIYSMKDSVATVKKANFLKVLRREMEKSGMDYQAYLLLMEKVKPFSFKAASDTVFSFVNSGFTDHKKYLLFAMLQYTMLEKYAVTGDDLLRDSVMAGQILALIKWFPDHRIIAVNGMMHVFNDKPDNVYAYLKKSRVPVTAYIINYLDNSDLKPKNDVLAREKAFIQKSNAPKPVYSLKDCKACRADFLVQLFKPVHILGFYFDGEKIK